MKKKLILILSSLIIITALGFIPFNKQIAVKVNAPYFNCYQQLFVAANWKNWQPAISSAFTGNPTAFKPNSFGQGFKITIANDIFLVKQQNSSTLLVSRHFKNNDFNYSYTIIPDTNALTTTIIATFKTNVIKNLVPALQQPDINKTALVNFKNYMEDAKQYYGFNIRLHLAAEKKIIVKSKAIAPTDIYTQAAEMQKQLHNFIICNHLTQKGPVMAQFIPKSAGTLQLMVGIPVNQAITPGNGFLYMYMPASKVLVADFNGQYKNKKEIYTALQKYVQDKFLHVKITPFEIYENKLPAADNDVVGFQLNYPIF